MALSQVNQIKDRNNQRVVRDIYESIQPLLGEVGVNGKRYVSRQDLVDLQLALITPQGKLRNPAQKQSDQNDAFLQWLSEGHFAGQSTSTLFLNASFTVGSEVADVIRVTVQVEDGNSNPITSIHNLRVYLSNLADGSLYATTPPDTSVVIGTTGDIRDIEGTLTIFDVITGATGLFDIDINHTVAGTFYLVLISASNQIIVSPVITFV